jgi:pimeloyl-ACP methyl ester carboxylesterase
MASTTARRTLRPTHLGRLEKPVFLAAIAAVAIHLADLSGLSSVASVLVALGLPLACALAYPHIRRSGRATLALVIGVIAFGTGLVGPVFHAVNFGPAWDDATGIAYAVAGLALVVLGVGILVTRAGEQPRLRGRRLAARAAVVTVATPVVFVLVVLPIALALMITHPPRLAVEDADLGRPYDDVTFKAADGTKLAGWYVPSRNGVAVILMHGSGGNRGRAADHARMLASHGYGVLLFDQRGHGDSGGHGNMLGWNAYPDVQGAIGFLERTPGVDHIAAHGLSMGGEVLLDAAARDRRIEAVISDGAENVTSQFPGQFAAIEAIGGVGAPVPLAESAPRIAPRPALLISSGLNEGEGDNGATVARAIGPSATHWEIPDAGHIAGLRTHPREYERRVIGFLDRAF